MNPEDIHTFFKKGIKSENDSDNRKREKILESLDSISDTILKDSIHGERWQLLQQKWRKMITTLCAEPYERFTVTQKGGRGYNYDFVITYFKENKEICTKQIEFKYNGKSIYKLPQFLQITENCGFLPVSYAEFYYDNYLHKNCTILNMQILDKEKYLKLVKGTEYTCDSFFVKLKEAENVPDLKKKISTHVWDSIKDFLQKNGSGIDLSSVLDKLKAQEKKTFVLWNGLDFIVEKLEIGKTLTFKEIKNCNTIVLEDIEKKQRFGFLLRWKNHKGVLNPAWQICVRLF